MTNVKLFIWKYYQQDIRPASELAPGAVAMRVLVVEQGLHGDAGHSLDTSTNHLAAGRDL